MSATLSQGPDDDYISPEPKKPQKNSWITKSSFHVIIVQHFLRILFAPNFLDIFFCVFWIIWGYIVQQDKVILKKTYNVFLFILAILSLPEMFIYVKKLLIWFTATLWTFLFGEK